MSRRKSNSRAKLKAACQEERICKWTEHFKNLIGNCPENIDKPMKKIINSQLDIKLGQFTEEEHDAVHNKIKSRKVAGLNKILLEVWKTRKFDNILQLCNTVYKQNTLEKKTKTTSSSFSRKVI